MRTSIDIRDYVASNIYGLVHYGQSQTIGLRVFHIVLSFYIVAQMHLVMSTLIINDCSIILLKALCHDKKAISSNIR